jgi:DnaJ-class molecular chaperone
MGNPFEKAPEKTEKTCPSCYGSGKDSDGKTCRTCNGKGTVNRS